MSTLYEIRTEYRALIDEMDALFIKLEADYMEKPEAAGITEEMNQLNERMAINVADFAEKAEAYAAVVREKEARSEALLQEATRMTRLAKAEQNKADYLKARLAESLKEQGYEKLDLPRFCLSFRSSQAVEVLDKDSLPTGYLRIKTVSEPDKTALKNALKQGAVIPGAALVERKSLQIR